MRDTKHLKAMCHSDKNCLRGRETEWFGAVTYYQTIISSCQYQNLPWELRKIHSICSSRIFYSCKDCKMIFGYMESTLNLNRGIQIFVAEFLFLFVTVESPSGSLLLIVMWPIIMRAIRQEINLNSQTCIAVSSCGCSD